MLIRRLVALAVAVLGLLAMAVPAEAHWSYKGARHCRSGWVHCHPLHR